AVHVPTGVNVDFYMASAENWGYIHWLRTGPGDANEIAVTNKNQRNRHGKWGIKPPAIALKDGTVWRDGAALAVGEEKEMFAALGMPYIAAHQRSAEVYYAAVAGKVSPSTPPRRDVIYQPDGQALMFVGSGKTNITPTTDAMSIAAKHIEPPPP